MLTPQKEKNRHKSNGNNRLTGSQLAGTSDVAVVDALAAGILSNDLGSRRTTALLLVDLLQSGLLGTSESEHHDEGCIGVGGVEEMGDGDRGDDAVESGHDDTLYPLPTTTRYTSRHVWCRPGPRLAIHFPGWRWLSAVAAAMQTLASLLGS